MNTLAHEYELFRMNLGENIYDIKKRFIHIFNPMRTLEKVFQNEDLGVKVHGCLNHNFLPKVINIYESRDL